MASRDPLCVECLNLVGSCSSRAVGRSFGPIREGRRSRPPRVSQLWVKYLVSTRHHWVDIFIVRRQGPDGGRVPRTQRPRVRPEEGLAPPGCTLPKTHHAMTTHNHSIPDRSPPGSTRTAPSAVHQDGGVKYAMVHHRSFEEKTRSPSALETQGP